MADDFRTMVNGQWDMASEADRDNRREAMLDLRMAASDQWDEQDRNMRERPGGSGLPRPCLTINTCNSFINQVVGDMMANQTSIAVLPREDGDKEVAEVRSELIRAVEHHSKSQRVYSQAFSQAVTCGVGNFRVDLDYAFDDAFERDLFVRAIPNPMAALWDPLASDPTGRDASFCFVADRITRAEYKTRFPKATVAELFDDDVVEQGWCGEDMIRVAEYWKIDERDRMIALFADGSVQDVTDRDEAEWQPMLYVGPDGVRRVRKAACKFAVMTLTNGQEELSDPFELKIPRLPIIRVTGQEIWVGERRVRFGLVRLLRDHQRMKNYLRSVATEKLMFAPRANFIAAQSAIKGRTADWPNAMVYNDGAPVPQPVTESNLQALIAMSEMSAQDMKDVTGIHDASLGMRSNETSGVAIQRRQHQGDIATIGYHDNMNAAKQEAGEVLNALIPVVYDTPRTIRVIGQDDAVRLLRANDPGFQPTQMVRENVDLAKGRYDVAISTGPAYMSRRQEAGVQLMELARNNGDMMARAGDLIVKALDIPDGDTIAERLRPPGTVEDSDLTPRQQQEQMQAAQMQQAAQEMEMQAAQAEMALKAAQVRKAEADADKAQAEAGKARIEMLRMQSEIMTEGAELAGIASGEIAPTMETI